MDRASADAMQPYYEKWAVQSKRIAWPVEVSLSHKRTRNA